MNALRRTALRNWLHGVMFKSVPLMINCREFEGFILEYLEGDLTRRQSFVFETHLKVCRECRDYLTAYQTTTDVVKRVFQDEEAPVPETVPEDLIKAVLEAKNAR